MKTIDYTKFKVEIFTPDGELIKDVSINDAHNFYNSGLVPGNEYNIVFSYDGALLLCAAFNCENSGRVINLSPAHFLYNFSADIPTDTFSKSIGSYIEKRNSMKIPQQLWEKKVFEKIGNYLNRANQIHITPKKVVRFKAGNDLAGKVK